MAGAPKKSKRRGFPERKPTTSSYAVKVVDDEELDAALAALKELEGVAALKFSGKDEVRNAVVEAEEAAKARLKACFERIYFQEIPPALREELSSAHPDPYDEENPAPVGYQQPYIHALAAASAVDIDQTPEEWADFTRGWSSVNWYEFANAVLKAQSKAHTEGIPKG